MVATIVVDPRFVPLSEALLSFVACHRPVFAVEFAVGEPEERSRIVQQSGFWMTMEACARRLFELAASSATSHVTLIFRRGRDVNAPPEPVSPGAAIADLRDRLHRVLDDGALDAVPDVLDRFLVDRMWLHHALHTAFGSDVDLLREYVDTHRRKLLAADRRDLELRLEDDEFDDLEREWMLGRLERLCVALGPTDAKRPTVERAVADYVEEFRAAGRLDEIVDPVRRQRHIDRLMRRLKLRYGPGGQARESFKRASRKEKAKLEGKTPPRSNDSSS